MISCFKVREGYDSVSESELDDAWKVALGSRSVFVLKIPTQINKCSCFGIFSRTKLTDVKQKFKDVQEETYALDSTLVNRKISVLVSFYVY